MAWQYTPYTIPLVLAGVISGILAIYIWQRRRSSGGGAIALLMLALTTWSLAYAAQLSCATLSAQVFWGKAQYFGIVLTPVTWFVFAVRYTGRGNWLTRRFLALLAVEPLTTLALALTNERHGLIWSDCRLETVNLFSWGFSGLEIVRSFVVKVSPHGMGFWVHTAYSYILLLVGTLMVFGSLARSRHMYRGQAVALLIFALAPWMGNALYLSGLNPFPQLDLTPFAFALVGPVLAFGLFRFRLGDLVPVAHTSIIEGMDDSVIMLDDRNRIVDLNPAALRAIGHNAAETVGHPVEQVLLNWPGLADSLLQDGATEREISMHDGVAPRTFDVRFSPLYDRRGHLISKVIIARDISERKRMEEALRINEAKYRHLVESANSIIAQLDTEGNITYANRFAEEFFGYSRDEVLGRNAIGAVVPAIDSAGRDLAAMIKDLLRNPERYGSNENENMRRNGERVWVAWTNKAILNEKGNVQEILCIGNDITDRKRMEEELKKHREQLEEMVRERTAELTSANEHLQREIAERIRMDEELRLSELRHSRILDATHDMICVYDENGGILYTNRGWKENAVYTVDETLEMGVFNTVHPDDRERLLDLFERAKGGEAFQNVEYRVVGKSGEIKWRLGNAALIDWPGVRKAILNTTREITERKRIEEELKLSELRHSRILDATHDIVFVYDGDGNTLFANRAANENLLYTPEETEELGIFNIVHPDDRERIRDLFKRAVEGQPASNVEYRVVGKNGEMRWRQSNGSPIDWPGTEKALLETTRDITERKQMEEEIRLSEQRYSRIMDSSHDMVLVADGNARLLFANRAHHEQSGYTVDEANETGILNLVHPDDRSRMRDFFERVMAGEVIRNIEYRRVNKNGDIRWVESNADPIHWPGADKAAMNLLRDITDRKRTQEMLRVSNRFLEIGNRYTDMRSLLSESVGEAKKIAGCEAVGIRVLDEEGNIPYESSVGLSESFCESESSLSTKTDQCMCVNVIKGIATPNLSFFTPGGSFRTNNSTFLLATVPRGERGKPCSVCNQYGYESVALIPIRAGGRIIGLIHVADTRENMLPLETVELLETAATELGTAILRVQMEQALMRSEEKYRNIFEEAPDIFYMLDLETWKITEANKCALEALEYGPERIGNVNVSEIIHPDDYEKAAGRLVEMVIKKDRMPNFPLRVLTRTGAVRHIEQSGVIFWDENGRARTFLGLAHDVTLRKIQEEMIRKRNDKLAALYEIARIANESLDLKTVLDLIVELVPRITNSDGVCIYSFDEPAQTLHYHAHRGFSERFIRGTDDVKTGEGLHGHVAQSGKALVVNNLIEHPMRARREHTSEFDHIIIVPLMARGRLLGTLTVVRKAGNPYDAEDLELMTAFANQIAVAIENAKLYSQVLQRETHLNSILETSLDGIAVTSEGRRVVYRNSGLSSMFGYDESDDLDGTDTMCFFAPESLPVLEMLREKLDRHERVDRLVEWKGKRKDGSKFDVEMRVGFFFENGMRYDVAVIRDITERKRLQAQLQQSGKLAAIGELATGVAHEINNPIATIHIQAGLMRDLLEGECEKMGISLDGKLEKSLRIIEDQVHRCQRVTNSLLSFSRRAEGKPEFFGINELLKKAVDFVVHLTDKKPQVALLLDEKVPPFHGDPNRLEQVFVNLLSNAVKAIPAGGKITIASALDAGGNIRIEFKDSGPGIPEEIKDRIFDPFFTTRPAGEGTGLGLSISHFIIKEMNGKLEAYSQPSQGAVFTVILPLGGESKENVVHV
ncbi:PAS domain S-box protein [Candidatus Poribacteria bacterium]|nr:PAS domain S-box protein [Candidatus Poribacteria bacterium]